MVRCDKFVMKLLEQGSARIGGDNQFHILSVPRGRATLSWEESRMEVSTGQSLLLPAAMGVCELSVLDEGTVLVANLPA